MSPPGKPTTGFGHYLRDMVYGALDGIVTTLAVVSGATGAGLEARVGLILGAANLIADGISMGASNYLGLKTELHQTGGSVTAEMPWRHGLATSAAFSVVGAVPLSAYLLPFETAAGTFRAAVLLALLTLALVGGLRGRTSGKPAWRSSAETLAIGSAAALAAYGVGALVARLTG